MNRFTIKNQLKNGLVEYLSHETRNADYACIQKLGRYEDIEKELGITLETYFKALNNGAWYKDTSGNICWCDMPKFSKGDIDFNGYHTTTRMYGVFWALTKEELK